MNILPAKNPQQRRNNMRLKDKVVLVTAATPVYGDLARKETRR